MAFVFILFIDECFLTKIFFKRLHIFNYRPSLQNSEGEGTKDLLSVDFVQF
jgi:hypothetical protein